MQTRPASTTTLFPAHDSTDVLLLAWPHLSDKARWLIAGLAQRLATPHHRRTTLTPQHKARTTSRKKEARRARA